MRILLLCMVLVFGLRLSAQDEELGKRTTIAFITSEVIGEFNFDRDPLLNWVKAVQQAMGNLMKTEKSNSSVKIIATWTPGSKCSYNIGICPANPTFLEQVTTALKNIESPVAKFSPFEMLFGFKFNDGCKETDAFAPGTLTTKEVFSQKMGNASIKERKELIRNWALEEVIPMLAHFTTTVDKRFEGVIGTGKVLEAKSFLNGQTAAVTDKNPLYWRGLMEMSKGNLIIPVSRIFMLIANDQFDLARRHIRVLYPFADKESLAFHYLFDLNQRLNVFYEAVDKQVQEGITLHDKRKYDEAINKYNAILAEYPNSAWALYEVYFSIKGRDAGTNADKVNALWSQHKKGVYTADPLYPIGGGASNAKDGYELFLHMEIDGLFKDAKKTREDLMRFADIAMDLESYAFAAHLCWNLYTIRGDEKYKDHDFLAYYLYCLHKLGVDQVLSFFKKEYTAEFAAIDKERTEAIKNNSIYKSFKEQ